MKKLINYFLINKYNNNEKIYSKFIIFIKNIIVYKKN